MCFYVGDVCVFRGEEKATGPMKIPLKELYTKLTWRYDDAPYVFGYAAVGYQVSLAIIEKKNTSENPKRSIAVEIGQYNLERLDRRLSLLLALLNLATLFRPVVKLIRSVCYLEYETILRPNGVTLSFTEAAVVKKYPNDMPHRALIEKLSKLHRRMKEANVLNVQVFKSANTVGI
ncbi:Serine/threonine protein kinase [Phytophthora megakarya]|uniref:Serine/threonine protein kinase n=1 Tax=Phytophthora megakarya TaxID=4795 RepID=A0A225VLS2_9STRA|nr:Serine/threonine protein kinase [Phytophthora megakarya]